MWMALPEFPSTRFREEQREEFIHEREILLTCNFIDIAHISRSFPAIPQ